MRSIDRNLGLLFWVIAAVGMAGYSLSLGASLWANTDRKRRELSVLRLLGFRGGGIMLYPSFHALFTAVWLGATFVYLLLEQVINHMLAADLAAGQSICFLMPRHFLAALFLTLIASLLGAVLGGVRAARGAGDVVLQLKSPYHDGTTHVVMSPLELMQLVPRPRLHLTASMACSRPTPGYAPRSSRARRSTHLTLQRFTLTRPIPRRRCA